MKLNEDDGISESHFSRISKYCLKVQENSKRQARASSLLISAIKVLTFPFFPLVAVEHKSSRLTSHAMEWRFEGVTGADKDGGGGTTGGGAGGGSDVSSNESSENLSSSSSILSLNWLFLFEFLMFFASTNFARRLFIILSIVWMLIWISNGVTLFAGDVGEIDDVVAGDIGRLMKSFLWRMKPLLDWSVGELSSWIGDFSSCDDKSVNGSWLSVFRHTSRWRSIVPGSVRGGTRFWFNGPG